MKKEVIYTSKGNKDVRIFWIVFKPFELPGFIPNKDVVVIPQQFEYIPTGKINSEMLNTILTSK